MNLIKPVVPPPTHSPVCPLPSRLALPLTLTRQTVLCGVDVPCSTYVYPRVCTSPYSCRCSNLSH